MDLKQLRIDVTNNVLVSRPRLLELLQHAEQLELRLFEMQNAAVDQAQQVGTLDLQATPAMGNIVTMKLNNDAAMMPAGLYQLDAKPKRVPRPPQRDEYPSQAAYDRAYDRWNENQR